MVLQCTTQEQLVDEVTKQVSLIWESWFSGFQQNADREDLEAIRKKQLKDLREKYLDLLGQDILAQIMRAEAAKYNNIRSR